MAICAGMLQVRRTSPTTTLLLTGHLDASLSLATALLVTTQPIDNPCSVPAEPVYRFPHQQQLAVKETTTGRGCVHAADGRAKC